MALPLVRVRALVVKDPLSTCSWITDGSGHAYGSIHTAARFTRYPHLSIAKGGGDEVQ
jgi:hypothetical protein